jgi:hypothetical protein
MKCTAAGGATPSADDAGTRSLPGEGSGRPVRALDFHPVRSAIGSAVSPVRFLYRRKSQHGIQTMKISIQIR